ncbi:MAG: hypothetical protein GY760_21210 [Deltaproteobacteria bacterium]|nr:hypothetical protein [Deltaproteobacteria bacterium]
MRELIKQTIIDAAKTAGLEIPEGEESKYVMDEPAIKDILLKKKRIDIEYLDETMERSFKRISKGVSDTNPDYIRIRNRKYKREMLVRATIQSDDEAWLAQFTKSFLLSLPHKIADEENNLVKIEANKAVRSGFTTKMVEVFKKRSNALHIKFKGMLCEDLEYPAITDINITTNAG